MTMKISALLLSALVGNVAGFRSVQFAGTASRSKTALFSYLPEHFDRAVECATKGHCDVNELERLADGKLFL